MKQKCLSSNLRMMNVTGLLWKISRFLANKGPLHDYVSDISHRVRFCCQHSICNTFFCLVQSVFNICFLNYVWIDSELIKSGQDYQASRLCLSRVCWSITVKLCVPFLWTYTCKEMCVCVGGGGWISDLNHSLMPDAWFEWWVLRRQHLNWRYFVRCHDVCVFYILLPHSIASITNKLLSHPLIQI